MFIFYPSRIPIKNSTEYFALHLQDTEFHDGGLGRTRFLQGGYQLAALALTLGLAISSGIVTGLIMRLPIFEQVKEKEDFFEDDPHWITPQDFNSKPVIISSSPNFGNISIKQNNEDLSPRF
jgi:ammonium transporter Rh